MKVCTIEGCTRTLRARGWCATHWARWKANGDPLRLVKPVMPETCEAPTCESKATEGRYCSTHRARLTRLGTFDLPDRTRYQQPSGYWNVKRPGHPVAGPAGWVREHRVVLFDAIGSGIHPCHWCSLPVSWDKTYPQDLDALVVDHIDENPGNNDVANLVPSCFACNLARSSRWQKRSREMA